MSNTPPLVTADHRNTPPPGWNTPPPGPVYGYDAVNNAAVEDMEANVSVMKYMIDGLTTSDVQ